MAVSNVIIVGAGINGAALAHALARRGIGVTVLERGTIAGGPTGRSCGIIRQHYSQELTARLALESLRVFENFDDAVGGACDFHQIGFILSAPPDRADGMRANVRLQRSLGIETQLIDATELAGLVPGVDATGIAVAAWEPRSGYADAHTTTLSYVTRARQLGAAIHTGVEVADLIRDGARVRGVRASDGTCYEGDAVVLATGPWTPALARLCGVELPIRAHRVQVGLFQVPAACAPRHVFVDTALGVYQRPDTTPMMLVGSVETTEADGSIAGPDDYAVSPDPERMDAYVERLVQRMPPMREGRYHSGYASLYDVTPDWQPIIDAVPGTEGMFCVAGSSGHGFKLAPAISELAADLVVGTAATEPAFGFGRFAAATGVAGSYPEHSILG